MTEPIKPDEIGMHLTKPDTVIEVFNSLIVKHWDGYQSKFMQSEAVVLICHTMQIEKEEVYKNHYLDVEPLYRKQGWKVTYDKPPYNESYPATFTFKKG